MSALPPNGRSQEPLKTAADHVDIPDVNPPTASPAPSPAPSPSSTPVSTTADLTAAMHELLDHVVGHVPGVVGAVVSSADGFALASRPPSSSLADAASIAAMSAAVLGLSNRLLHAVAPDPVRAVELRSEAAHGYVFAVGDAATLTLLTAPESERSQVMAVGREITIGLLHILRS